MKSNHQARHLLGLNHGSLAAAN
ncbi:ribosome hibernation factor SRA [Klebsiella pneumoniae]